MPKIQHLELFYYVARHRGISRAIRHLPSGISQPALSTHMTQVEEDLGCRLFQRHPFVLTPEGEKLYAYIRPFFEGLNSALSELRGSNPRVISVASTPLILREYFPEILTPFQARFPDVPFALLEGAQKDIDQWFEDGEADLMINVLEGKPPAGCRVQPLLTVPLILLVPTGSPVGSLKDLLKLPREKMRVLAPPRHDAITRKFREGLSRGQSGWIPLFQANSLELIETYVRRGHGIGLSVLVPGRSLPLGVRAVSLPGFPTLRVGAVWRGPRDAMMEVLLHELKKLVKQL